MSVSITSSTLKLIQVKKLNFPGMEKTFHRDRKLLTDQICRQKKTLISTIVFQSLKTILFELYWQCKLTPVFSKYENR